MTDRPDSNISIIIKIYTYGYYIVGKVLIKISSLLAKGIILCFD